MPFGVLFQIEKSLFFKGFRSRSASSAGIREVKVAEVNYKRAVSEFNDAQRQVDALEAEALKALTGENQLDLGVVNSMLLKQKPGWTQPQRRRKRPKFCWKWRRTTRKPTKSRWTRS